MAETVPYTPSELLLRKDPIIARHQEEGRQAFGILLEAVGGSSFSGHVIAYLRTYLKIDKAIIALFSGDLGSSAPELLFHNIFDTKICELYLSYLQDFCLPGVYAEARYLAEPVTVFDAASPFDEKSFVRAFRRHLGIASELRLIMPLDDGRVALLLLSKAEWMGDETELAVRCATFLRPAVLAHDRSLRRQPGRRESDWQVDHVRKLIGGGKLTAREVDIALQILNGDSTGAIAEKLDISAATVKVHRRHIYDKLNISCQAELFGLAFRCLAS
ncbi:helix-turn-helix transcriptional regulator [Phenylobacterium sp. LjRoot225]|uniref:helix-turn-helix transcriptional regulator n=1 Tax=Phenylobacterium sp. LjRoot225 TaxID=3342285 RepID=UPI003ED11A61